MPTALPPSSQGCGEGWELKPTWEEHSGEGVWSLQVVNEDALEGLTAGGLLVPGEGRRWTKARAGPQGSGPHG